MIRAVVFDVGYTLIDEARHWAGWARAIGVSQEAFTQTLRTVIAEGKHHRDVFARLRPDFDLITELARRDASPENIWTEEDLYPDARPALQALKDRGLQVGLAGNQPPSAKLALERLSLPVDWISNSAELGAEKPSPEFFAKVARITGLAPEAIAYVGDRLDNDVLPAQAAGMRGVFVVRGPWGENHAHYKDAARANYRISSLNEISAIAYSPA